MVAAIEPSAAFSIWCRFCRCLCELHGVAAATAKMSVVPVPPFCCVQFKDWFSNPLTGAVETGQEVSRQLVERLHGVLRPFLLR